VRGRGIIAGYTKDARYRASACLVNTDARTTVKIISPTTPFFLA